MQGTQMQCCGSAGASESQVGTHRNKAVDLEDVRHPEESIGPKSGVYRAQNTIKKKRFLLVFIVIIGFYGALIIPKWLINNT